MSMTILMDYKKKCGQVDARDNREMRDIIKAGHEINKMKAYGEHKDKIERVMGKEVNKIMNDNKEKRIRQTSKDIAKKVMPQLNQFK